MGILGYIIIVVTIFWTVFTAPNGTLIFGDDIHRSYYFFSQYLTASIKSGFIPWWNPYNFAGTPFLANPITNAFYPINWLFFILPANVVYPVSFVLHLILAMSGMYLLR